MIIIDAIAELIDDICNFDILLETGGEIYISYNNISPLVSLTHTYSNLKYINLVFMFSEYANTQYTSKIEFKGGIGVCGNHYAVNDGVRQFCREQEPFKSIINEYLTATHCIQLYTCNTTFLQSIVEMIVIYLETLAAMHMIHGNHRIYELFQAAIYKAKSMLVESQL